MNLFEEAIIKNAELNTRRHFLKKCLSGMGALTLGSFLGGSLSGCGRSDLAAGADLNNPMRALPSHFIPKAKRVIYLHMAGAPSQLELFDYKPELQKLNGLDCPPSLLEGKRFAFIEGTPQMLGPQFDFKQHGQSGAWVTDRMPHFANNVDDVCFLKAMHTDEFNHAPAQLLMHTGSARLGKPSIGSWVTYGLGSENQNLPGFVVFVSGGTTPSAGKSIWGSGFLPTVYQGVQCRSKGDPVLYLSDPKGVSRELREKTINIINDINQKQFQEVGDPEIMTRISQYEMAFKMQMSVPETMDISDEPEYIHEMYGTEPGKSSFANNCLLARRLAEKGVRFIQLYHYGWDSHGSNYKEALNHGFNERCQEVDKPISALLNDLKQRGLLDDTLVVWGGEFGRTPMRENRGGKEMKFLGRDHHLEAFTMWMAGGGVKSGYSIGETDEIGYYGIKDRVHVHDLQATILHLLGMDHEKLTYQFQGRDFRLTDVHGNIVEKIIA
ncbi:DUF1501 domain-containing protein [Echinicola shivajiensis]|uniref:DUF1501 domain-containing protein n=1 Tax=Echinicola shivajiensis TaxID=1035916 RepID=UPI001BFC5A57|nr:DUF1501 domain-containing protein [Echinicola shivajiensis]